MNLPAPRHYLLCDMVQPTPRMSGEREYGVLFLVPFLDRLYHSLQQQLS
jgi:hypothetical protein